MRLILLNVQQKPGSIKAAFLIVTVAANEGFFTGSLNRGGG